MRQYPYMPLGEIAKYEREMAELRVSLVARSPRGFLTYYKKIGGRPERVSEYWRKRRNGFIVRHLAQYKVDKGYRRRLALIAWAYNPTGRARRAND